MADEIIDIEERSFVFAVEVINTTKKLPRNQANQVVVYQEVKAVTSINSNIVQGRAGVSRKDFINHYRIALKEAKESKRWLQMLVKTNQMCRDELAKLIGENDEIIRILVSSIKTALENDKNEK